MKRLVLITLILSLFLCGCTADTSTTTAQPYYSFTDSTGVGVTLKTKPQKVAVLFSSYVDIWNMAGGEVSVTVGESVERGFVPDDTYLVDSGAGKTIDCERLLAAMPDFVIASADIAAQAELKESLANSGIPVALFRVDTFDQYLSMLKICTEITENDTAYTRYGTELQERINTIKNLTAQQSGNAKEILFIRAGSKFSSTKAKCAPENFVCIMLNELGAKNIAEDAPILLDDLSVEEIILRDPDYIFLTSMGSEEASKSYIQSLFEEDGWRELSAVKNKNYTFLEKELFHFKPNARWDEAYAILADLLYPELSIVE